MNPDEIDADVREHIANELHTAPRPVPVVALEAVLAKLGPPEQWGPVPGPTLLERARLLVGGARTAAAERARRVRFTLLNGPDDWRLAYLSFGVFALGVQSFFLFPLALVVSYFLSRAGLAVAREKGIELGAGRKWLLYPPVVLVSLTLLVAVVAWPVALGGVAHEQVEQARNRVSRFYAPAPLPTRTELLQEPSVGWRKNASPQLFADRELLATVPVSPAWAPAAAGLFVGFGAVALWWTVLGVVAANFPGAVRAACCPLLDGFERHHGVRLAVVCGALLLPWATVVYEVVAALV